MRKEEELKKTGKYLTIFQRKILQKTLQTGSMPTKYRQRIQIMLMADEGKTQAQISQILNCSVITVKYWTMFASAGNAHQWQSHPLGRPKSVSEEYLERLKELVNQSPQSVKVPGKTYTYPYQRWTAKKLGEHLAKELEITISDRHVRRLLKEMGLSTRNQHQQAKGLNSKSSSRNRVLIEDLDLAQVPETSDWFSFNQMNSN